MATVELYPFTISSNEAPDVFYENYSYHANPISILERIFLIEEEKHFISEDEKRYFDPLRGLSKELYLRSTGPYNTTHHEILGEELWQNENGLSNRMNALISDTKSGLILKTILSRSYNSADILRKINDIGLITDSEKGWEILAQLEEWKVINN